MKKITLHRADIFSKIKSPTSRSLIYIQIYVKISHQLLESRSFYNDIKNKITLNYEELWRSN